MALNDNQKALAKSVAVLVGTTLKIVPDQADVQEYSQFIKDEIDAAVNTQPSANPVKDETEAILDVANNIDNNLPDGTNGKKKLKAVISFVTGVAHMFGL